MAHTCEVCKREESRYRCPTCRLPYCSARCYKEHRSEPCYPSSSAPSSDRQELPSKSRHHRRPLPTDDADPEDKSRLSHSQLRLIAQSEEIRKYLQDSEIRTLITAIDQSRNPEKELDAIRVTIPKFEEFARLLVRTVAPDDD